MNEENIPTSVSAEAETPARPVVHAETPRRNKENEPRRHPVRLILSIIGVLLFLSLVFTCPDREAHKSVVVSRVNTALSEELDKHLSASDSSAAQVGGFLGGMVASKIVEMAIDSRLEVNNYFLFSVSRITLGGKTYTLSYGFLNHVYTFDKTDLTKALREVGEEKAE